MKQTALILLVILTLISCGKKVTLKGRVYNPLDDKGIEGVDIQIAREKMSFFSYDGAGSNIIENTTTDKDGNYLINYRHKSRSHRLFFAIDKDKYINVEPVQYNISQENQTIDLPLVPFAYLKRKIKNVNCFDADDKIEVFVCDEFGHIPCNLSFDLDGCADFMTDGFSKTISGYRYYHWKVTKNNEVTHYYDTLFLEPFEEHYYEILY